MLRKQKWAILGGVILLALCMIVPGVSVLAASTTVGGTVPLNISNAQVTNIKTTTATISWNTNNPSSSSVTSQVSYGTDTTYSIGSVPDTSSGLHSVNLSSLLPGTKYYYQIQSTISGIPTATYVNSFTTASLPLNPIPSLTNVILVSIPNPSDFGQTVDFGVAVFATKLNGIPTGTVTYFDGKTQIGTSTLDGLGLTSFKISTLSVGSHNITAVYGGDTKFLGSTSNIVVQKVQYDTKTSLTSNNNPSITGQSVTFTATVTAAAGTPTGTVTFNDGSAVLGTGTLSGGKATCTTKSLSVGSHPITASYGGDPNNDVSTSSVVVQVVNGLPKATVILSSSLNPSDFGQMVKFTATVSSSGATGSVTFYDGSTSLGTATLSGGIAFVTTSSLTVGLHNITAVYGGNTTYASSTSNTVIQKVKSKTTITWPYKPSPCNWGQPCTFKVQLGWQGSGNPTGYVTFYDGSNNLGNCNLSGDGSASFSIGNLGIGNHNITAVYNGDDNNDGSTSGAVTQTVNAVSTVTSLSSSVGTSVFGQSVTFTANVSPATATGTVTLKDGSKTLGTAALSGGSASFSINTLAVGSHSITAVYGGDTYNNGSTSSSITETVVAKPVITTTSLPNGTKNINYSQTLLVSGGSVPFTWSISGAPSWLSINALGVLSGKPNSSGTYTFTVKVTDSLGNTATQSLSIKVN
jgi:Bacterial Ig-like domain (group 3)/Purple acid Phosphatase, N-terminal domain